MNNYEECVWHYYDRILTYKLTDTKEVRLDVDVVYRPDGQPKYNQFIEKQFYLKVAMAATGADKASAIIGYINTDVYAYYTVVDKWDRLFYDVILPMVEDKSRKKTEVCVVEMDNGAMIPFRSLIKNKKEFKVRPVVGTFPVSFLQKAPRNSRGLVITDDRHGFNDAERVITVKTPGGKSVDVTIFHGQYGGYGNPWWQGISAILKATLELDMEEIEKCASVRIVFDIDWNLEKVIYK